MDNRNDFRSYAGAMGNEQGYGSPAVVATASPAERGAFLRKVYVTLTGGVAVTMASAFYFTLMDPIPAIKLWQSVPPLALMLGYMALSFVVGTVVRVRGINLLAYLLFTAFTGFFISPILLMAAGVTGSFNVVLQAFGISVFTFVGLTGYVLISGKDFSFMKGFLWTGFWMVFGALVMGFWIDSWAYHMAITAVGLLVFIGFILYDTSRIMLYMGPGEWVAGAFSLFIDFINMFIRVLYLLIGRRN